VLYGAYPLTDLFRDHPGAVKVREYSHIERFEEIGSDGTVVGRYERSVLTFSDGTLVRQ